MLTTAKIASQEVLCPGVFRLTLTGAFPPCRPGQFAEVLLGRPDLPLPRPFGVVRCLPHTLELCYRVTGKGTEYLSTLPAGAPLRLNVGLGNGFDPTPYRRIALVGGGIGIFPLHSVPLAHPEAEYGSYLGFRTAAEAMMLSDFARLGEVVVSTDDGTLGVRGNAVQTFCAGLDAFRPDAVFACGPLPLFRSLKAELERLRPGLPAFVSLEERMGCGVGACLVCTCDTVRGRKRVCTDGPVFPLSEVIL